MTNGEIIMQKAKKILAYCNTFTQDEVERSFLGEIDLEEESAKRAIKVYDKAMFGTKIGKDGRCYLCEKNKIIMYGFSGCSMINFDINQDPAPIPNYTIDYSDIITLSTGNKHTFFNNQGFFIVWDDGYQEGVFFE